MRATDLRAGAAMIIAGLAAHGVTKIEDIEHIQRGYEDIVEKLRISDCACIRCTMAQEAAVSAVSTDVAQIKVTDAPEDRADGETVRRMGAQLTL